MIKEKQTLNQICKMIASGEIPKEVYNKYLSNEPIGFMTQLDMMSYLSPGVQCEGCKYEFKLSYEIPCKICKRCCSDFYAERLEL